MEAKKKNKEKTMGELIPTRRSDRIAARQSQLGKLSDPTLLSGGETWNDSPEVQTGNKKERQETEENGKAKTPDVNYRGPIDADRNIVSLTELYGDYLEELAEDKKQIIPRKLVRELRRKCDAIQPSCSSTNEDKVILNTGKGNKRPRKLSK